MLRLPELDIHQPHTLEAALGILAQHGADARVLSGGTDLLPNTKLRQTQAKHLISVRYLPELAGVELQEAQLRIGGNTTLANVAEDELVRKFLPALAFAVGRIASPQIRRMGTLAGNLCLDTRCRYINQSELWREALGGCLKSHGNECHVVPGGQGCVAALSSDSVPVLIAYGAEVELAKIGSVRRLPVADLYDADGLNHVNKQPDEVLTAVYIPLPNAQTHVVYRKWAVRKSIDFPLVSVALRLEMDKRQDSDIHQVLGGLIAVGVLGPRPRVLGLEKLQGRLVDESLAQTLGQMAFDRCRPLPNVPYEAEYRRERLATEVRRAVRVLAGLPEHARPT